MFPPFELIPVFKNYIWGGTKLRDEYNKNCDFEKVAESWELSCHEDGTNIIADGLFKNKTLAETVAEYPELLGTSCRKFDYFPVLIKLIDAKDNLSVQVHPDNNYAMQKEGTNGKTEMWYVLECEDNASVIYGFKEAITKEDFVDSVSNNTLLDKLNVIPVKKGDVFFTNPGTIHAIGKGILIAEIQQNSNITYRVFDYDRKDINGNTRELHIEKALDVINFHSSSEHVNINDTSFYGQHFSLLSNCEYFSVYKADISEYINIPADKNTFMHLLVINGNGYISGDFSDISLKKGSSIFVPAGTAYNIKGNCSIIITVIK